ncbi:amidohydrolase/deacetylase family metallohydrolase [Cyclobacterium marinum]|uniref:Amidohydrolase n=1 Tax=Cyclobacterium marinum (strain ATCC 25205 / DSM 745 / LMG 13164 / NCIMB 1802) TaxID=880070 RepID=G0IUM1_CYCMS|nr:amidohydrolase/deacetylase family metallohydrolase [Cyclobacterium marinum]AEL24784.1 amidohydrolase [Cyclobacterium marinum DSM 745]|tara:strand:+ start:143714 stop:144967 length:1254 start_codon:yes stop_codon:yes gene_type:complete
MNNFIKLTFTIALLAICSLQVMGQQYDLLIKGGHVIDAKNNIDEPMDIAIKGDKIALVQKSIEEDLATQVIDATGLFVSPGLIDIHTHNFYGLDKRGQYSNGYSAIHPDGFTLPYGVTTVVDAGGSGWRNFIQFKEQVIDRVRTRVFAMLNIVGHGMKGALYEQNLDDMDPKMAALVAKQFPDHIVGFKVAHYAGHQWQQIDRLVQAGELADIPVMVDFGGANPPLSLETLFMEKLRPGDIYTHIYGGGGFGRQALVDPAGRLRPFIKAAQERGIIFDVGHGGSSFAFKHAIPSMQQGIKPNTISTDSHMSSIMSGMKNMTNVMSKFLNMGMNMQEIIAASTWKPAQVINHTELGHLSEGAIADIAILNVLEGNFGFTEKTGVGKMMGKYKIENELTIKSGKVVWDLNGLTAPLWDE